MALVKEKSKDKKVVVRELDEAGQDTRKVVDLTEALRKSVTGKKADAVRAKERATSKGS